MSLRDVAWSYVRPWKHFQAEQLVLAERADAKLDHARKFPVLQDVTEMRVWFVSGAQRSGRVQSEVLPVLRRGPVSEQTTEQLPLDIAWSILRFVGVLDFADGTSVAVVGADEELSCLRSSEVAAWGESDRGRICDWRANANARYTGPGAHDEQLSAREFYALRHVEIAARLEYMAEARGRPRPGQMHPDAEADDPDGAHGGARRDSDGEFSEDSALPGGEGDDGAGGDADAACSTLEPELAFRPVYAIGDDEVDDVVHRAGDAEKHMKARQQMPKQELLRTFMDITAPAYAAARSPWRAAPHSAGDAAATLEERKHAKANQEAIAAARAAATDSGDPAIESKFSAREFQDATARGRMRSRVLPSPWPQS